MDSPNDSAHAKTFHAPLFRDRSFWGRSRAEIVGQHGRHREVRTARAQGGLEEEDLVLGPHGPRIAVDDPSDESASPISESGDR